MKATPRLIDLPLPRLLNALADAERVFGADASTTRAIAETVRQRLQQEGEVLALTRLLRPDLLLSAGGC